MRGTHLDRSQILAVLGGERPDALVPAALAHLLSLCPECKAAFDRFNAELREQGEVTGRPLRPDRLPEAWSDQAPAVRDREAAARSLEALLALPAAERRARIAASTELRGPALAELLLVQARGRLPARPRESRALAELARAVLEHGDAGHPEVELYARALAYVGNAQRVQGELPAADELFADARYLLRCHGGADRLVTAELDALEASLRRAQRRFPEALELLERALGIYAREGRALEAARALLKLGFVHREAGDLHRAVAATEEALTLLDPEAEPRLALMAGHNLAQFHADLGDYEAARYWLDEAEPLYRRFSDAATQLRRLWLEGNVARGMGQAVEAERAYLAARAGYLGKEMIYNAALVSLQLAALYLEQGRTAEVQALAEQMLPRFEAREVHREAAVALMLFVDAARSGHLSIASVDELTRYLEAARQDPAFPFRPPA